MQDVTKGINLFYQCYKLPNIDLVFNFVKAFGYQLKNLFAAVKSKDDMFRIRELIFFIF